MARATYLEDTCRTALNRVPDESRLPFRYTVNPYRGCAHSCHYCFARAYHSYLDLDVGEDFSSRIVVKTNVAEVLRRELASPRWTREAIAMGTATDPYQQCEGRYRLTRAVLEALVAHRTPLSLLTKSTLVLRDLDLLRALDEAAGATLSMSVGTVDEAVRRVVEPGTPPAQRRLDVLARFAAAGIRTSVLVAPILPGLTDDEEHLDAVLAACRAAGVRHVTPIALHVRAGIRPHFLPWLARTYPELVPRYRELYGRRAYAPADYRARLAERFDRLRLRHGLAGGQGRPEAGRRAAEAQLSLAV
ncbi:MAG: radical SAM protein [Thermoleophilia bacterium]